MVNSLSKATCSNELCQQKFLNAVKKPDSLTVVIIFIIYLKQQPEALQAQ